MLQCSWLVYTFYRWTVSNFGWRESGPSWKAGSHYTNSSLEIRTTFKTKNFIIPCTSVSRTSKTGGCWYTLSVVLSLCVKLHLSLYSFSIPLPCPLTLLTPCSRVLLDKITGSQKVKKFPALYGIWKFITAFTSACHLSPSWARSIQSMPPTSHFLKIHLNIILSSTLGYSLSF